jgi:hypothetical protein
VQDALRGGSHEANGPDGARRSSLRQWIVGLCRRGGRLLTHKTIFHVCSIIACVTRAVIEIMRCVMPLGYLDVRQLTYRCGQIKDWSFPIICSTYMS